MSPFVSKDLILIQNHEAGNILYSIMNNNMDKPNKYVDVIHTTEL